MAALTADRYTLAHDGGAFRTIGVAAGKKIFAGSLVLASATGMAEPGTVAVGLTALGRAEFQADNSLGVDGAITVKIRRGIFNFASGAGADAITIANIGQTVYVIDDQTVGLTNGTNTRSAAGEVFMVDADGVWVEII
jgi:hypothetical protein